MRNFIEPPLCTKALTSQEQAYLTSIMQGLDNQVRNTRDWLLTEEAHDLFINRRHEIDEFFANSGIEESWNELINSNAKNSEEYVTRFYNEGAKRGYQDIHRTLSYTKADREALFHLKTYNFELIKDINQELVTGLRETISNGVAQGVTMPELRNAILKTPLEPINGKLNVKARAMMIARTEYGRARTVGRLQAYTNYGVELVEVVTAGDAYVCEICQDAEAGNPYEITDTENLPLFHPNCRCAVAPVVPNNLPSVPNEDADVVIDDFVESELNL